MPKPSFRVVHGFLLIPVLAFVFFVIGSRPVRPLIPPKLSVDNQQRRAQPQNPEFGLRREQRRVDAVRGAEPNPKVQKVPDDEPNTQKVEDDQPNPQKADEEQTVDQREQNEENEAQDPVRVPEQNESDDDNLPEWIVPYRAAGPKPQWCDELMNSPRPRPKFPLTGECGRKKNTPICADGKPMFFGWKNEDIYLWTRHFRHLRRPGVFLDIAAANPVSCSNTYFFERCLGWSGICVEGSPSYLKALTNLRTCALVTACVSNRRHRVTFVDSDQLGGVRETNKNIHNPGLHNTTREVECVRTGEVLDKLAVTKIDYFNLDVEGHELFVLQGIDWATTNIGIITVESNKKQVKDFLLERGYELHIVDDKKREDALRGDWLFVHESVEWGNPV